jgi:hypothetical protein
LPSQGAQGRIAATTPNTQAHRHRPRAWCLGVRSALTRPVSGGRVAGRHCCLPAPSELHVLVSSHAAQALGNASTGIRGCPIGLGVNLSATAAEPATEMVSVAAGAPARVLATPPTYLPPSLRRLADGSRPPTPGGSLPTFVGGNSPPLSDPLQVGIRFLPRPLPAAPSAYLAVCFPQGGDYGLTTFRRQNRAG